MKIRSIVLIASFVLLNAFLFDESYCQPPPQIEPEEGGRVVFHEDIVAVHSKRTAERIDMLKQQSLDETFMYLLESQQYFFPGYQPPGLTAMDMETLLSTRSFLKVFQQWDALPTEERTKKLHEFCQKAIMRYERSMDNVNYNSSGYDKAMERLKAAKAALPPGGYLYGNPKYMLCASLFLAARSGDIQLLVSQLDAVQRIVDRFVDIVNKKDSIPPDVKQLIILATPLEDDVFLTIIMYGLKQAGKDMSIPSEEPCKKKTVKLCRWDAPLTYYDFAVRRGTELDPKDVVDQFDVYEFSGSPSFGDPEGKKKQIIQTLKERLAQ